MKKLLLATSLAAGLAATAFGQGQISIDNLGNTTGLFYIKTGAAAPVLLDNSYGDGTFQLSLLAGSSAASLASVGYTTTMYVGDPGQAVDGNGVFALPTATGFAGGQTAFFQVQVWEGNYASYAAAVTAGALVGQSATFTMGPLGGGSVTPPNLATMPDVTLAAPVTVPEPGTFALAGLGAAAMLIFRRRK